MLGDEAKGDEAKGDEARGAETKNELDIPTHFLSVSIPITPYPISIRRNAVHYPLDGTPSNPHYPTVSCALAFS